MKEKEDGKTEEPSEEVVKRVLKHLKEKGYNVLPPHVVSPLEAFLKRQSKSSPWALVRGDKIGDAVALRDVGRAFHVLVPQTMDTLYNVYAEESDRRILDDVNCMWIAIYNAAINNEKGVPDMIRRLMEYANSSDRRKLLYAEYGCMFHQSLMTYLLVTLPVLFGLCEYDTEVMAEYGASMNLLAMCETAADRKTVSRMLQRQGHVPAALSIATMSKWSDDMIRLVEEEREFQDKRREEGSDA